MSRVSVEATEPEAADSRAARRLRRVAWLLLLACLVAIGVFVATRLSLHRPLVTAVRYARRAGWEGYVVFGSVYLGAVVLGLPTSLLTVLAGFLYGPLRGSVIVIGPSLAGAALAYALARSVARERIKGRLRRYPRAAALSQAVGEQPVTIMTLLRLSPILPSNILNYVFALTDVKLAPYLWACVLAMVPGTLMFAYAGSLITSVSRLRSADASPGTTALTWVGLAATAFGSFLLTRLARRALRRRHLGTPAKHGP